MDVGIGAAVDHVLLTAVDVAPGVTRGGGGGGFLRQVGVVPRTIPPELVNLVVRTTIDYVLHGTIGVPGRSPDGSLTARSIHRTFDHLNQLGRLVGHPMGSQP